LHTWHHNFSHQATLSNTLVSLEFNLVIYAFPENVEENYLLIERFFEWEKGNYLVLQADYINKKCSSILWNITLGIHERDWKKEKLTLYIYMADLDNFRFVIDVTFTNTNNNNDNNIELEESSFIKRIYLPNNRTKIILKNCN